MDAIEDIIANIELDIPDATESTEVIPAEIADAEVIKMKSMADDLIYSIEKLRNNIDNSERILDKLTLKMVESDEEDMGELINQYSQIESGMNSNIALLHKARKDISVVLTNLQKAKAQKIEVKSITNNVNIESKEPVITADIIAQLEKA